MLCRGVTVGEGRRKEEERKGEKRSKMGREWDQSYEWLVLMTPWPWFVTYQAAMLNNLPPTPRRDVWTYLVCFHHVFVSSLPHLFHFFPPLSTEFILIWWKYRTLSLMTYRGFSFCVMFPMYLLFRAEKNIMCGQAYVCPLNVLSCMWSMHQSLLTVPVNINWGCVYLLRHMQGLSCTEEEGSHNLTWFKEYLEIRCDA